MPEREVRYCTSADGTRLAYTVTGSGPPIVFAMEPVVSHAQLEWSHSIFGRIYQRLARTNTLIRLDTRGVGMSDRPFASKQEENVWDIEAVVDRLQLQGFAITGVQSASLSVAGYAARHPDRVTRIVFIDGFLRMRDLFETPQIRALVNAAEGDFEMATEMVGAVAFGSGREESVSHGAYIRSCVDRDFFANAAALFTFDATPYASALTMPALVIRHEALQYVTPEMTRDLVSRLPDARLITVPGLWADNPEGLADQIAAFVTEDVAAPAAQEKSAHSGLRTVLFTDIVGHTEMMQRLGDEQGRAVLREHERITREMLQAHGGVEVKTMGDGFMASFGSVTKALECAVALQRAFAAWNHEGARTGEGGHAGPPLQVRVGLNAGEPIEEDGDLFGSTVILASRIAAQAGPGEILVPDTIRGLASGKGFFFSDRGEVVPKGFEDPVRLYEVRWHETE